MRFATRLETTCTGLFLLFPWMDGIAVVEADKTAERSLNDYRQQNQ
jgi:hypothetical protein